MPFPDSPLLQRFAAAKHHGVPLIIGHRGFPTRERENTSAGFLAAERAGADGVELDVQLSRDGLPVIIHDRDLTRIAGESRRVSALDAAALAALGVPTLEHVFEVLSPQTIVDIELKSYRDTPRRMTRAVAEQIRRHERVATVLVSSFDPRRIRMFRLIAREMFTQLIPTAAIFSHDPQVPWVARGGVGTLLTGSEATKPDWRTFLNRSAMKKQPELWARRARPPLVWTINEPHVARSVARFGVAALIGDDPAALRRWITEAGE